MTDTNSVRPLTLPALDRERARLGNALLGLALPARIPFGRGEAAVSLLTLLSTGAAALRAPVAMTLLLSVNGLRWRAALPNLDVLKAHPLFSEPELAETDPEALPKDLSAAVAETLATPLLASLASLLGVPVVLEDVLDADPAGAAGAFGLELRTKLPEGAIAAQILLSPEQPESVPALSALLAPLPARSAGALAARLSAVPFTLALVAGGVALSKGDYEALGAGDVLLPDLWLPAKGAAQLTLLSGRKSLAAGVCRLEARAATLADPITPFPEKSMQQTDSLEVRLVFELEERTITLGELGRLEPGYVFTLTADASAPVTITANGQAVAKGRLVDVNGAVGVQITETK